MGASFSYDYMGNVTNDGTNTYSYDAEGRPVSVNLGQPSLMSDAFGRTIQWNNGQGVIYQAVYGPQGQKFASMEGTTLVWAGGPPLRG